MYLSILMHTINILEIAKFFFHSEFPSENFDYLLNPNLSIYHPERYKNSFNNPDSKSSKLKLQS